MYLKRIEIQGFKSFADKTIIEFKDEITAIVGPNGSGKSNISDAIRWVLGEQSIKYLRGSKMEDVIFSGTDKRKPLGFAEVIIIFDNNDFSIPIEYNEVSIRRRMFRSGESEYYINNHICRLKDIRRLIMDTGIGKEGYSIIGQGRIDEILSNRPEDRRNIFEEAAGIVKYRSKKEEAMRKLNNTEENLIRISDLVSEISDQYQKLEIDAKKAVEFAELYEEVKSLEVSLFVHEIQKIKNNISILDSNLNLLEVQINEEALVRHNIENNCEGLEAKVKDLEDVTSNLIEKRERAYKENDKINLDISLLKERYKFCEKDLNRLKLEKATLKNLILANIKEIEDSKLSKKSIEAKYKSTRIQFDIEDKKLLEANNGVHSIRKEVEENREKISLNFSKTQETKNQLESLNIKYKEVSSQIGDSEIELEATRKLSIESNNRLLNKEIKIEQLEKQKEEFDEEIKRYKDKENKLLTSRDNIVSKVKKMEMEINSLSSNLKLYKNMDETYEGYYRGVKNLFTAFKNNINLKEGFIGSIADLIHVDKLYEKSINISLGSAIQNIVVENEVNAKNMIDYLKKHNLGRVTFLPLNIIKGTILNIDKDLYPKYGIHGLGSEITRYKSDYVKIFNYLLGRTIIIEDIDKALAFSKDYGYKYKIVTIDGQIINPGGSLTGGSTINNNSSILNRKKRIIEIEQKIKVYNDSLSILKSNEHINNKDIMRIKNQLNYYITSTREIELELIDIKNKKDRLENEQENLKENCKLKSVYINHLKNSLKEIQSNLHGNEIRLENLSLEHDSLIRVNEIAIEKLGKLEKLKESISNKVSDLRVDLNVIENKVSNIENNTFKLINMKESNESEKRDKSLEVIKMQEEIKDIELNESQLLEEKKFLEEKKEIINDELNKILSKRDNVKMSLSKEKETIINLNNNIIVLEKNKNNLDLQITKLELQSEHILTKLKDTYDLNYEKAILFHKEIENIKKSKSKIEKLKKMIKELGSVNLASIEDFKSVKERLHFLNQQHTDLTSSKDDLRNIIKDMEVKMRKIFIKSFEEINKNFSIIFSHLFNGGKGALILEDESDVLNSGIEIEVQPPGKRLQNINLLSGGEKSLTAVAILFAILKTKPSPFCILDEIDAALDEANISRYTEYLRGFKDDTQFILITHRKTTMEIANLLYGVTMENEGVSRLVSVKLKNYLEEFAS